MMIDKIPSMAVVGCYAIRNIHAKTIVGLQNTQLIEVSNVKLEKSKNFELIFQKGKIDIFCMDIIKDVLDSL